jgi:hypothetical protein
MRFKSYVAKVFVVESSKAIIRDEQFESQKYQAGEALPPGKQVGDVKTIPQRTEIKGYGRCDRFRQAHFCLCCCCF